jgi:glycosyltransferase involved in cell wall biosynthesis
MALALERTSDTPYSPKRPSSRWVHAVPHLDPKYGGLSSAVPALVSAVANAGEYSVSLAGFCRDGEHFAPPITDRVSLHYLPHGRIAWLKNEAARRAFRKLVSESAGVHIHGLWQMSTSTAVQAARAFRKPYIISAHGMLESWALANKALKKKIYAALFERANLQSAGCLHALTEAEARDYRRFGLKNPIAVIPNGVEVPAYASPDAFLEKFPELRNRRLILFLGRLHFKKGLDILAEAWARVSRDWPEAHLVLAGPNFEGTQAQIEERLARLAIRDRVTFTGMLVGDLKWSALAAAQCFVLPSYSEGLSVSVLEAMGFGVPVVVTEQCNLPCVGTCGCGWVIRPTIGQLTSALADFLRSSASRRTSLGKNGQRVVAQTYRWPAIGQEMTAVYRWLNGGAAPEGLIFQQERNR